MRIYLIILFTLAMIIGTVKLSAQTASAELLIFPDSFTNPQQEIITSNLAPFPKNTQASILIMEGDKTSHIGITNKDWQLTNIKNKDSVFEIGSISKVFTSALLADAVLKGDVDLETQISDLLGYSLLKEGQINLQQLSNHTSGMMRMPGNFMFAQMKDPNNPYLHYDETMLKTWLTEYMTTDLKQDQNLYSNLGAALLAHGLTKKYKKTYDQLLSEVILTPLNMESTTTKIKNVKGNLIQGLDASGQETAHWEFDVLEGAGAILSSTADLAKFASAVMSGDNEALELLKKPTFKVNDNMEMGLGWHIINGKGGNTCYWHNGGTSGFTSSMLINTDRKKAIIMLSNISAFHPKMGNIDGLVFDLMKTMN